jgi:hypothetical protein
VGGLQGSCPQRLRCLASQSWDEVHPKSWSKARTLAHRKVRFILSSFRSLRVPVSIVRTVQFGSAEPFFPRLCCIYRGDEQSQRRALLWPRGKNNAFGRRADRRAGRARLTETPSPVQRRVKKRKRPGLHLESWDALETVLPRKLLDHRLVSFAVVRNGSKVPLGGPSQANTLETCSSQSLTKTQTSESLGHVHGRHLAVWTSINTPVEPG